MSDLRFNHRCNWRGLVTGATDACSTCALCDTLPPMTIVYRSSAHVVPPNFLTSIREVGAHLTNEGTLETAQGQYLIAAVDDTGVWSLVPAGGEAGYPLTRAAFAALRSGPMGDAVVELVAVTLADGTRIATVDPGSGPPDPG